MRAPELCVEHATAGFIYERVAREQLMLGNEHEVVYVFGTVVKKE